MYGVHTAIWVRSRGTATEVAYVGDGGGDAGRIHVMYTTCMRVFTIAQLHIIVVKIE
jgi:hypothetical protein